MSNQALEAWSTRSLHGLTAWKRPEPTKWAVVVILCARATKRENEVFTVFGQVHKSKNACDSDPSGHDSAYSRRSRYSLAHPLASTCAGAMRRHVKYYTDAYFGPFLP
jgi:hypothetical protein